MLIVLRQPPIAAEPAKGPLHDPPPFADLELCLAGLLARDLQDPAAVALDPGEQGTDPVRRVGPDLRQPRQQAADPLKDFDSPVPVGRCGRQYSEAPDQAERVNEDMPLAAGDFFSPRRTPWVRRPRWS
jgi:hypothetical protein